MLGVIVLQQLEGPKDARLLVYKFTAMATLQSLLNVLHIAAVIGPNN